MTPTKARRKLHKWRLAQALASRLLPNAHYMEFAIEPDEIRPGYSFAQGALASRLDRLPWWALWALKVATREVRS